MDWHDRITTDAAVLAGKPIVRDTRIAVEQVIEFLAAGWTTEQILDNYPSLELQDIHAALAYAAEMLKGERIYSIPT